jgi:spore germination protein GerM
LVTALVALALAGAGCDLPTNRTAIVFDASPTSTTCAGKISMSIYLVDTNAKPEHLTPVVRSNEGDAPVCAIYALNAGPTASEQINGIETRFLEIPGRLGLSVKGNTATVQLDEGFISLASPVSLAQAFGQVVYTLTGLNITPKISRVQFTFDNRPYPEVVLPNLTTRATGLVTRADYCAIGPPGQRCGPPAPPG